MFRRRRSAVALLATGVALAGCGSAAHSSNSTADASGATGTAGSSASSTKGILGLPASAVDVIGTYTGSHSGRANAQASPVVIGYVNQQGAGTGTAVFTPMVNALTALVNDKLGGIDGHPLKLLSCFVQSSDEDAQACGQRFAAAKVRAVLNYPVVTGAQSFFQAMKSTGTPLIGPLAATPQYILAPNGLYAAGTSLSGTPVFVKYLASTLHVKTVAIVTVSGDQLASIIVPSLVAGLKAAGITAHTAQVSPTSSDATAPLLAAHAPESDAIAAIVSQAPECEAVAKTLQSLNLGNKPVIGADLCATPGVQAALGYIPKWTYAGNWPSLKVPPVGAEEAADLSLERSFGQALNLSEANQQYIAPGLQGFLNALRWINRGGGAKSTKASIMAAAKADTGATFLSPSDTRYGRPPFKTVGYLSAQLYSYTGTWKNAVPGGWVSITPSEVHLGGAPPAGG